MIDPLQNQPRGPRLDPIVQPGTSRWAQALVTQELTAQMWPNQLAITSSLAAAVSLAIALTTVSTAGTVIGVAIVVGILAAAVAAFRAAAPRVVRGYEGCRFQGVPITGPAFHLMVDIQ